MYITPTTKNQQVFGAKISQNFLNIAEDCILQSGYKRPVSYGQFLNAVEKFDKYGSDVTKISFKKEIISGTEMFSLYATKQDSTPVLLASKDNFRKLLKKFVNFSQREFDTKVKKIY